MRKTVPLLMAILLASSAAATTFESETVEADLETSTVTAEVEVSDLTSERFNYFTSYRVSNLRASLDGERIDCEVEQEPLGSEVSCPVGDRNQFTIEMEMEVSGLTEGANGNSMFIYSKDFIRPTETFDLRVILPEGNVLAEGNASAAVSPEGAEIGSNGRRITVEWSRQPSLGESQLFRAVYRPASESGFPYALAAVLLGAAVAGMAITYLVYRLLFKEEVEELYDSLDEDKVKMLEMIRDEGGEVLQKDLVDSMEFSKAKISGMSSELVEEGILEKRKEGRSNKLYLARKYR